MRVQQIAKTFGPKGISRPDRTLFVVTDNKGCLFALQGLQLPVQMGNSPPQLYIIFLLKEHRSYNTAAVWVGWIITPCGTMDREREGMCVREKQTTKNCPNCRSVVRPTVRWFNKLKLPSRRRPQGGGGPDITRLFANPLPSLPLSLWVWVILGFFWLTHTTVVFAKYSMTDKLMFWLAIQYLSDIMTTSGHGQESSHWRIIDKGR